MNRKQEDDVLVHGPIMSASRVGRRVERSDAWWVRANLDLGLFGADLEIETSKA